MWRMHEFGGWGWGMGIGMVLFWVVVIVAIVVLLRALGGFGGPRERHREKTALDILTERYARGEIGKEEFEQKKRDIG